MGNQSAECGKWEILTIHGRAVRVQKRVHGFKKRGCSVLVRQGDGPVAATDRGYLSSRVVFREKPFKLFAIAERRAHQQELRVWELHQRDLPRPPAVAVAVKVELIRHDQAAV